MLETASNLYGTTTNPHNVSLTPGGSSGGEGALIALRGSPLGIGGEYGGANGVPATHCGLYSFRPTSGRVSVDGLVSHRNGCEAIPASIGPLAPTLSGVRLFMQSVIGARQREIDPYLDPTGWRDESGWLAKKFASSERLRIGVVWDDGVVKPLPPILHALEEVVSKLRSLKEIEVVDYEQDYRSGHELFVSTELIGSCCSRADSCLPDEAHLPGRRSQVSGDTRPVGRILAATRLLDQSRDARNREARPIQSLGLHQPTRRLPSNLLQAMARCRRGLCSCTCRRGLSFASWPRAFTVLGIHQHLGLGRLPKHYFSCHSRRLCD